MRKKISFLLVLALLLALPVTVWASPLVRIGIINGKDSVTISGQRSFTITDAKDGSTIAKGQGNEKWHVEYRDGQLYLNKKIMKSPFVFRLEPGDDNEYLVVDGRRYRGELEIRPSVTKKGITIVEIMPMEEYIYGIIPWEISPAWPMEAVKAQAVAARTYALYHLGKHKKDGFDLCNTTDCQVYGGREAEDPRGNWAVDATKGMVVTYKNKLVPTFFHSSSGGYTENVENVWSGKMDYLRAVPDYDQDSPYFQWKNSFTLEEIGKKLESAGYKIGALQGIKLSPLYNGINEAADRGVSGRVKTMTFIGSEQNATVAGNDIRRMFNLNSTLFDIRLPEPVKQDAVSEQFRPIGTSPTASVSNTVRILQKSKKKNKKAETPEKRDVAEISIPKPVDATKTIPVKQMTAAHEMLPAEPIVRLIGQAPPTTVVTFEGHGSGHGLGLSQWGAKAMAEQGPKDDRTYYQQILKHYYQGVDITKWY